ncbi:MAG: nitronate monooxygenase, partial [Myxococcota bacterium]
DPQWIETEIAAAGNTRVGIGFITWSLARKPELHDQALTHAPAAVMLSFGDPAPFAPNIKAAGAKLVCQVQTLTHAARAAEAGADVIVAQGGEAGGHGASRGTLPLVPAVVDAVAPIPVVIFGSLWFQRRLAPRSWVSYTNLAEVLIDKGSPRRDVERWNTRGEKLGADPAVAELNLCLVSWRDGNVTAAERHFKRVRRLNPAVLENWHEAPVSEPIQTLADLMRYCCVSPACGPYLAEACEESQLEVARREIPEEVAREELRLEMERRRKLEAIYDQRRDLEIQIEEPEPVPAP